MRLTLASGDGRAFPWSMLSTSFADCDGSAAIRRDYVTAFGPLFAMATLSLAPIVGFFLVAQKLL